MATSNNVQFQGDQTASADLSTHQFKFVKQSGVKTVTVCAATTDIPTGVLYNNPTSGQAAQVAIAGKVKVICGAAVTAGQEVMSDTSGRAITATGSGNRSKGVAQTTTTTAGELVEVLLDVAARAIP